MDQQPLTEVEVMRTLALIEKGQQLGGQQPTDQDLDRARRILTGELTREDARIEVQAALQALVDDERGHPPAR